VFDDVEVPADGNCGVHTVLEFLCGAATDNTLGMALNADLRKKALHVIGHPPSKFSVDDALMWRVHRLRSIMKLPNVSLEEMKKCRERQKVLPHGLWTSTGHFENIHRVFGMCVCICTKSRWESKCELVQSRGHMRPDNTTHVKKEGAHWSPLVLKPTLCSKLADLQKLFESKLIKRKKRKREEVIDLTSDFDVRTN
jgi:hypothetical protein